MPVKPNGEIYFNVTVYREAGSDLWQAESTIPGNPDDEGARAELFVDAGTGGTPGEALGQLAVTDLTDEAIEQIAGPEEAATAE